MPSDPASIEGRLAIALSSREHAWAGATGAGRASGQGGLSTKREPAFNAPAVVVGAIALFVAIHAARSMLTEDADLDVLLRFAFIPARYDPSFPYQDDLLGGPGAKAWTFITYALLHGNLAHLAVNSVWMLAFGSALAFRFGAARFLAFSAVTAAAGAAAHLATHFGEPGPVIGASAAISGHMAATLRFMFQAGGPLGMFRRRGARSFRVPAEPLLATLRRPQALIFVVVWFAANAAFGLGGVSLGTGDAPVAWQAHIGGFLAGLLLFPLLDPTPRDGQGGSKVDDWPPLPPVPDHSHDGDAEAPERR